MKSLLIVLIYSGAAIGAGNALMRILARFVSQKASANFVFQPISVQFALGSALLASIWQVIALGGFLRPGLTWLVLLLCLAFYVPGLPTASKHIFRRQEFWRDANTNWILGALTLCVLGVSVWFGILAFVRPPFGDADAFYFVYPKIIAATGELALMPGNYRDFSSNGLSGELHFSALMAIGTPEGAKLFAWVTGMGLLFQLRNITKVVGGGTFAQVAASAMLVTSTTFSDYLSDGKVDLFAACTAMAATLCLLNIRESKPAYINIILAGFLTGISIAAKFSYIVAFLPAVLLLLWFHVTKGSGTESNSSQETIFKKLALFCFAAFIGLLPHLLKNYYLFGQPLAPFVGMTQNWADQNWFSVSDTAWIVATYPFALVFGQYPMQGGNISIIWLAALPLILLMRRPRGLHEILQNPLGPLSASACVGLLCWLLVKPSVFAPRYLLATLVMLMPLPAIAAERVLRYESRPRAVLYGFVLLVGITLIAQPTIPPAGVWSLLPGKVFNHIKNERPACGLAISSYCSGFALLNATARKGERTFVAGYYTYFLRTDQLQCINQENDFALLNRTTPSEIWTALFDNGFTHIAVQKATHGQYLERLNPRETPSWLKVTEELAGSDMPIYRLESLESERRPRIVCASDGRRSWAPSAAALEAQR